MMMLTAEIRSSSHAGLALAAALLLAATGCRTSAAGAPEDAHALPALKTVGNQIVDSHNRPVRLRGVNAASMEYNSRGEGHIFKTVNVAIHDWGVNIIRLPLSQDYWFGKSREQTDGGVAYRALVREVVDNCVTQHCYVILDLHWSDCNEWGVGVGQHSMPDTNSVVFWKDFAPIYANNPAVIFDLYNEPHDVPWDVWLKGGRIMDKPNTTGTRPPAPTSVSACRNCWTPSAPPAPGTWSSPGGWTGRMISPASWTAGSFPTPMATASFIPITVTTTRATAWTPGSPKWNGRRRNCR